MRLRQAIFLCFIPAPTFSKRKVHHIPSATRRIRTADLPGFNRTLYQTELETHIVVGDNRRASSIIAFTYQVLDHVNFIFSTIQLLMYICCDVTCDGVVIDLQMFTSLPHNYQLTFPFQRVANLPKYSITSR